MHKGEMEEVKILLPIQKKKLSQRERRQKGMFIKGPIPLDWITKAACLPGKTMNTALALWFLNGLFLGKSFKFTRSTYKKFGVSRFAVSKHLKDLEESGLITVERAPGRALIVMVIEEP